MQYIVNSDLYFKKLTYEYQDHLMIDEQLTYVFLSSRHCVETYQYDR